MIFTARCSGVHMFELVVLALCFQGVLFSHVNDDVPSLHGIYSKPVRGDHVSACFNRAYSMAYAKGVSHLHFYRGLIQVDIN